MSDKDACRYTASELKQFAQQREHAYDGIEIVHMRTFGYVKGKPVKGQEIVKKMDSFDIAERKADFDMAVEWVRYIKGSTKGYTFGLMRDWLNGVIASTLARLDQIMHKRSNE